MNTTAESQPTANFTILIVEDHDAVRASLRDWLGATFPDCCCLEANSGEDAVALVARRPPDLVLMDIGLPGMNGIEATQRIKTTAPQTHIVMLSIHEAPSYQAGAIAAGASAYVAKRKMTTELIPVVRALLGHPDGDSPRASPPHSGRPIGE